MTTARTAAPLTGATLLVAAIALALSNFMVMLDTTIANVSVPHIAGGIGISPGQGTWIITSYAVAEAICVPLTGFLTARLGSVRLVVGALGGFALFSMLCGVSTSLGMLVAFRVGQGLCGGPLMPLTQTLLLRIFPKERHPQALALWAMTTVVAPILGPILGGVISDNWSWHWIFFINLPIAACCIAGAMRLLRPVETPRTAARIDTVGLGLLVVWISALQIMLDIGHDHDWFADPLIVALAVIAAIGFALFCAWELTEAEPAVDIRIFRHRGFTVSTIALALAYGTFFASAVIIPQWLQGSLGYTATWSGFTTAFTGVAAVLLAPVVGRLSTKIDLRALVCFGILWLGGTTLLRVHWTSGADFRALALPQLLQGVGMPFFFIPITAIGLAAVDERETVSAAGLMSFLRTMAGAIGTSLATTSWDDGARAARSTLAGRLNSSDVTAALAGRGMPIEQIRAVVAHLVDGEATAIATNQLFLASAAIFLCAALLIWASPAPRRTVKAGMSH